MRSGQMLINRGTQHAMNWLFDRGGAAAGGERALSAHGALRSGEHGAERLGLSRRRGCRAPRRSPMGRWSIGKCIIAAKAPKAIAPIQARS